MNIEDLKHIILRERPRTPGAPPGVLHAPPGSDPPTIDITLYNKTRFERRRLGTVDELDTLDRQDAVLWVDVNGLGDPHVISAIGRHFSLHKLSLEDVVNIPQRPKAEAYENELFWVMQMPLPRNDDSATLKFEQISVFLGKGFVISFQSSARNWLTPIVERLEGPIGRLRGSGPDYLAYAIVDLIMDSYFPVLEAFDQTVDLLEDEILNDPKPQSVERIYRMKRDLVAMRRFAWGMREAFSSIARDDCPLIAKDTGYYLRDAYDHSIRVVEIAEQYRDLASGLMDWYQTCLSQRMNEIMKTLTIIATVFIPLTFIAGIYGMNFDPSVSRWNMPELAWRYGYPAAWALMLISAAVMYVYFRRKGWLGR